jgi:putative ABC transport system permease protein
MLTRKMLRDMSRNKSQFVSIFLMAFLALFIYTGVGGEWRGLAKSSDHLYREANLADIWLYGNGFTAAQESDVLSVPGITQAERRLKLDAAGQLTGSPHISLFLLEKGLISSLYITEGAPFDIEDTDGIWLDTRFADAHGLKVGDSFGAYFMGMSIQKTIAGLVYSAEYVFMTDADTLTPDFSQYGHAYLSFKALPLPGEVPYNTLLIKTDGADPAALESRIEDALEGKYSVYLEQHNHPSVSMFANETAQHKMMGDIFPVVFLLIALLTMVTTMTRMVNNQRTQIGTLKALGFKKNAIIRHYVFYGFWLALLGSALGMLLGPMTLPYLFYPSMSGFYTLPEWLPAFDALFVVMAAAVAALCTLMSFVACRRTLRDTPAVSLRPKAPRIFRHGFLEKTALWRRLGFNAQWNLRDAARNRVRSLMAVIGVLGCTALIVCALGMNDSMNDMKKWQFEDINLFESKLSLGENITPEQLETILTAVSGEAIMEGAVEIRASGANDSAVKKSGTLMVTDNVTLISPTDVKLRQAVLPEDGISITLKMAEMLGAEQGDTIEWSVYGSENRIQSRVSAIYRDPANQGIYMSREHFESLGFTFRATSVLSAQKITGTYDGVERIQSTAAMIEGWDDLTEAMDTMVYLLIAAAAVLSIVVLYNLGVLSFTEMEREMATLKVMGMKTSRLRSLLLTQNLWFSAIGFALGVPAGQELIKVIVSFSGDSYDFPIRLHGAAFIISLIFTFGLSILVSLMFSRKIRRLNMVEALGAVE